jgi:hypothetical protein
MRSKSALNTTRVVHMILSALGFSSLKDDELEFR